MASSMISSVGEIIGWSAFAKPSFSMAFIISRYILAVDGFRLRARASKPLSTVKIDTRSSSAAAKSW